MEILGIEILKVLVGFLIGFALSRIFSDKKLNKVLTELDVLQDEVRKLHARYEGIQQLRSDLHDLEKRVSNNEILISIAEKHIEDNDRHMKYVEQDVR